MSSALRFLVLLACCCLLLPACGSSAHGTPGGPGSGDAGSTGDGGAPPGRDAAPPDAGDDATPGPGTLVITTTSLPLGDINAPYQATLAASGGATPYAWSITAGA
ncbi:MAG TPA: hypothetical protein VIY73_12500, partial [Polyangiaceae bacterium]